MGRDSGDKDISGGHVTGLISAYIDGALGAAQQEQVRAHIAECAECRADYVELKAVQQLMQALPLEPASRAFTLTPDMIGAKSQAQPSFLARMLAPALAPRLATGSVVAFVLLLLVFVADIRGASKQYAASTTAAQPNSSSARAYATAGEAQQDSVMASTAVATAAMGSYASLSTPAPQLPAGAAPTTQAEAGTDGTAGMGATPVAGMGSMTAPATQGQAGRMATPNNNAAPPPVTGTTGGDSPVGTAPAIEASGNSSPTTLALSNTGTTGGPSSIEPKALPPLQAPAGNVDTSSSVSSSQGISAALALAIEAALGTLAIALAVAAAIARWKGV